MLVVDASQGVEAQTLANTYLALDHDLEIRPVLNKIDLPAADPGRVKHEIEDIIGLPALDAPEISAKQGINIPAVLEDIVHNVPAPAGDPSAPLKALIFDSQYDPYLGVIVYFRVMEGTMRPGSQVRLMASGAQYTVLDCGYLRPLGMESAPELSAGEVGWFTASIKTVKDTRVGDTITEAARPTDAPLPGYRPAQAMVYCGVYTEDGSNINTTVTEKESGADAAFKIITADLTRETLAEMFESTFGVEPTITDRFFSKDDVCGLPAYQYCYDVELDGVTMTQLLVTVNADKLYAFTYTDMTGDWIDEFQESAKNIELIIE